MKKTSPAAATKPAPAPVVALQTDAAATPVESPPVPTATEPAPVIDEPSAPSQQPVEDDTIDVAQPDDLPLEDQLLELGLAVDADGLVSIEMLTSMSGPDICLNRLDPHRCDPAEAVRLTRAEFARPAR